MAILIKDINTLVTMDEETGDLRNVDVLIEDNLISTVGKEIEPEDTTGLHRIDGSNLIAYPGFINTHHHFYQSLTRNIPYVQNAKLFDWLVGLYQVWRGIDEETIETAAQIAAGELLLSGCTTSVDHFYVFPQNYPQSLLDLEIETVRDMGLRFHPTRGSMSRGESNGGLPPDELVQTPNEILRDAERVIDEHHDPSPLSMCRIILAPCSPFSVTPELMVESARLARNKGVLLHTHLCETIDEEEYCLQSMGKRPLEYMEDCEWVGPDVFYAHGIYFNDEEIGRLAETGTAIAHCPGSNLRLGSGICRVPYMLEKGVTVGLAVDGSASNDSSNFLREMQLTLLVHRVGTRVNAMPPRTVLELATLGGARLLNRSDELGKIKPGMAADLALFRLDRLEYAGAMSDPAAAPLMCGSGYRTEYTICNGKLLVENGRLMKTDEERLFAQANEQTAKLLRMAQDRTDIDYYGYP